MSSKNDENLGLVLAIAVIGMIAAAMFAIIAFIAFGLTILSFFAWSKPLRLGDSVTITPEEAHAFVWRGVLGAILLPVFATFACVLFGARMDDVYWFYLIVGGYSLGSVGVCMMEAQEQQNAEEAARMIEMYQQAKPQAQPRKALPRPEAEPFRFASWDDEEERGQ